MKVALRELLRRPGRFTVAGVSLALLTSLLLLLGGLLDGLYLGSTGALRAQDAQVFVYSADARDSLVRSRVDSDLRATVTAIDGVDTVGGLGVTQVAGNLQGGSQDPDDLLDVAVVGYEMATGALPDPPGPDQGYADTRLRDDGVAEGDTLLLGPTQRPVEVVGFADDTSYLLQGTLWVDLDTWRAVQSASRPDAAIGEGITQVLLVDSDGATSDAELARLVDEATGGRTSSLTRAGAVLSLPGTAEQNSTFNALIGTTFFVVGLVTALFFVLITVERTRLFAAMKALGVPGGRLVWWSVIQAAVVAAGAFVLGALLVVPIAVAAPSGIPLQIEVSRVATTAAVLLGTSVVGSLVTLRRILRIDPASAIS